jgi:hypothetical protein
MNAAAASTTKSTKSASTAQVAAPVRRYTGKTADPALAHLERVLSVSGAMTIFSLDYWRRRVAEIAASSDLTPTQHTRTARIARLLEQAALQSSTCR